PGRAAVESGPALLVLSAQSEAQLVEQARRLHGRLAELSDDALADVAWTLQTGRMALQERLAFAATSLSAARDRLESFIADPQRPGSWVRGTVRSGGAAPAAGRGDETLRSALADWTDRGTHDRLLRLWADGAAVRWEEAHPSAQPARRISLPGYPFARDRCWFDLDGDASELPALPAAASPRTTAAQQADDGEMVLLRPVW
ncbi:hypothetical protein AB4Z54_55290, partial [Streptomyces sp. MCAF7]